MKVDFKELYAYSVSRIKENINFNYQLKKRYSDEKEFYQGAIFGLFECLDMMRSDVIVASDEQTVGQCSTTSKIITTMILKKWISRSQAKARTKNKRSRQKNLLLLILLLQRFKILFNQKENIFGRFSRPLFPSLDSSNGYVNKQSEFTLR